ncbi:MAG: CHASE domain-containing protein [Magnetococcales bacterium]|nr:CHASE domain-containing protein [Magnetococcales bacterium]
MLNNGVEDSVRFWLNSTVVIAGVVGVVLSVAAFITVSGLEQRGRHIALKKEVTRFSKVFQQRFEMHHLNVLKEIARLHISTQLMEREMFALLSKDALQSSSGILSLQWVPLLMHEEREHFEERVRSEGHSSLGLYSARAGSQTAVGQSSVYYPVLYVEPREYDTMRVGYDHGSDPLRREALEQAAQSGVAIATAPMVTNSNGRSVTVVIVYQPVYRGVTDSIDQRVSGLVGFAVGVFDIGGILKEQVDYLDPQNEITEGFKYSVDDITDSMAMSLISAGNTPPSYLSLQDDLNEEYSIYNEFPVSGRHWRLGYSPRKLISEDGYAVEAVLAFVVCIMITLISVARLKVIVERQSVIEGEVDRRIQELQSHHAQTAAILNTALNAIITMDEKGRVTSFNPAAEMMFGYQAVEVVGQKVNVLMPEPYRVHHDGYLKQYLAHGEHRIIGVGREVQGRHKDGEVFPIWLSVGEADLKIGKMFVGCIVDISAQKQVEERLILAKEQAEAANQSKSVFLNTMSHELRTPLTVILGYMPLLVNPVERLPTAKELSSHLADQEQGTHLLSQMNEQISSMASKVERNGKTLLALITDLLDLSRMETGKYTLRRQPHSVQRFVRSLEVVVTEKAMAKGLKVVCDSDDVWVNADEERLKQILMILLDNAIKFTEKGTVSLTVHSRNDVVRFAVSDTGVGIPPDQLQAVFHRFHQVDGSTTRKVGGTGLGLAIAFKLVEMHDGQLSVESSLSHGSTFAFSLQRVEPEVF